MESVEVYEHAHIWGDQRSRVDELLIEREAVFDNDDMMWNCVFSLEDELEVVDVDESIVVRNSSDEEAVPNPLDAFQESQPAEWMENWIGKEAGQKRRRTK
ncbi:hypothetical protein GEMRC1_013277 [Eukaryota sp. GEM-RC1]